MDSSIIPWGEFNCRVLWKIVNESSSNSNWEAFTSTSTMLPVIHVHRWLQLVILQFRRLVVYQTSATSPDSLLNFLFNICDCSLLLVRKLVFDENFRKEIQYWFMSTLEAIWCEDWLYMNRIRFTRPNVRWYWIPRNVNDSRSKIPSSSDIQ